MKELRYALDGETVTLKLEKIGDELWVHVNGEILSYAPPKSRRAKSALVSSDKIIAPMPGKIIKLRKNVGDKVSEGEVVVVMEAMKMEYSLKASGAGTLGEIKVKPGDQVTLGQVLIKIELT